MTITKLSPAYAKYTHTELKRSIRQRGIQATRNRKQMMRALREADREATFRFFDLPPEMRNMIYEYAMEIKEVKDGLDFSYISGDPTVLRTCKAMYQEAAGILYGTYPFELAVTGHDKPYTEDMRLNGRVIDAVLARLVVGRNYYRTEGPPLEFPVLLERIQRLKVKVNLERQHHHDQSDMEEAGGRLANDYLYDIYRVLSRKNSIRQLQVELSCRLQLSDTRVRKIISPLSAIGAICNQTTFNSVGAPKTLLDSIKRSTAYLRILRPLADDIRLAFLIAKKYNSNPESRKDSLEYFERLLKPCLRDELYKSASDSKMEKAIKRYEVILKEASVGSGKLVAGDMGESLYKLKEKQKKILILSQ